MTVKTPTQWQAPSGTGFFSQSGTLTLTTLSALTLVTLSGLTLITDQEVYSPRYNTSWTSATKSNTQWQPGSGSGFVVTIGTENFTTNSGSFLTDNSGKQIVTTTTYAVPKYATQWTETGV